MRGSSTRQRAWRIALALLAGAAVAACTTPEPSRASPSRTSGGEALRGGVTLSALLHEMVDLAHLTRLPEVPYTTHLKSSHNPRSYAAAWGSADWHADQDYTKLASGTETLLDVDGPGVLTRIWSARPRGTLRIFLDGAPQPAIEAELAELLRGDVEPFRAPFAFVAAHGHNLYFPIAFARSCKVTLSGEANGKSVYYHIGYRRYPTGTRVEPFGPAPLAAAQDARAYAAARLLDPTTLPPRAGDQVLSYALDSGAGGQRAAAIEAPNGGGVLRELRLSPAARDPERLRATALVIEMDGEVTVRAPLLDLFALGFEAGEVRSLPVSTSARGVLRARWPMPFRRHARIWLEHAGAGTLGAELSVTFGAAPFGRDSLYFYAGFHAPAPETSEPTHDRVLAEARGAGFYVGNVLNVVNPSRMWWGEGDERVYVDGERAPSHVGTGTEDYYGYAWCSNLTFSTPYVGQTASSTHQSFGRISLYRFHVLDPIPFTGALRFDLEVSQWGPAVDLVYDSTSVWYARPGSWISGARATDATFRLPALGVEPPADVPAGPYRC